MDIYRWERQRKSPIFDKNYEVSIRRLSLFKTWTSWTSFSFWEHELCLHGNNTWVVTPNPRDLGLYIVGYKKMPLNLYANLRPILTDFKFFFHLHTVWKENWQWQIFCICISVFFVFCLFFLFVCEAIEFFQWIKLITNSTDYNSYVTLQKLQLHKYDKFLVVHGKYIVK